MKNKPLVAVLTAMLLMFNVGLAMAAPSGSSGPGASIPAAAEMVPLENIFGQPQGVIEHFEEDILEAYALEIEVLELRMAEIELREEIIQKYADMESRDSSYSIDRARELFRSIQPINQEIQSLNQQVAAEWQAFRQSAVNENDYATAQTHIDNVIDLKGQVITKINDKHEILDEISDVLTML